MIYCITKIPTSTPTTTITITITKLSHWGICCILPSDPHENDRLIKGIWSNLKFVSIINITCWIIYKSIANISWLTPLFYTLPLVSLFMTIYAFFKTHILHLVKLEFSLRLKESLG